MWWIQCILLLVISADQAAPVPEDCDGPFDLVFVIDSSVSVVERRGGELPGEGWGAVKEFTKDLVEQLSPSRHQEGSRPGLGRAAVIQYGSTPRLEFNLDQHRGVIQIQDAISRMVPGGGNTNTAGALSMTRDLFHGDLGGGDRRVAVVLTDGLSNVNSHRTVQSAEDVRNLDVDIYTVTTSNVTDDQELQGIASSPAGHHVLMVDTVRDLHSIVPVLIHRICNLPDPTEPPHVNTSCSEGCSICSSDDICTECGEGWYLEDDTCQPCSETCELCEDDVTCLVCKIGWYWDPHNQLCQECEVIADLALLIDTSGSIRDKNIENQVDNFVLLKNFLKEFVGRVEVHPDKVRVGVVPFSTSARTLFHLDDYSTSEDVQKAIDDMPYGGGHTNTSGAIRIMMSDLFNGTRGDREHVADIAIVVTDGESNRDPNRTIPEADLAKQSGVTFFVIGVTDLINEQEVKAIASDPDSEHYFNSPDIQYLENLLFQILKHVCDPKNSIVATSSSES